jgi:hypothetical protein
MAATALARGAAGTGLTAINNAAFFIPSTTNGTTAFRTNLLCHLNTSLIYWEFYAWSSFYIIQHILYYSLF